MLRWMCEVTRKHQIKHKYIYEEVEVANISGKLF